MTTETMTLHEALAEMKIIDGNIRKTIDGTDFVCANKHSNTKIGGKSILDFREEAKSRNQKIGDLMRRRNALKAAIVQSNAQTTITLDGETYTIAQAIDMKNSGMENYKYLRDAMKRQYESACRAVYATTGDEIERKAEAHAANMIAQAKEAKGNLVEMVQKFRDQYIENNTYDLIDPLDAKKIIDELEERIENFLTKIDAQLSISNAKTIITFSY